MRTYTQRSVDCYFPTVQTFERHNEVIQICIVTITMTSSFSTLFRDKKETQVSEVNPKQLFCEWFNIQRTCICQCNPGQSWTNSPVAKVIIASCASYLRSQDMFHLACCPTHPVVLMMLAISYIYYTLCEDHFRYVESFTNFPAKFL